MEALDLVRQRPDFAQRQPVESIRRMVRDIVGRLGRRGAKAVLGIPALTLDQWLDGRRNPSAAARRWIIVAWLLLRYPGIKLDWFDLITEGRYLSACVNDTPTGSVPASKSSGPNTTSP